jgi:putative ABC transport system permease protein
MKNHFPQTILTFIVATFVTGTLSVLFFIASSFQSAVRNYALEQTGNYHYQYYTDAGTPTARLLEEMAEQFQTDNWFSNVEYADDGNTATLTLTVAHPGLFTTRTMKEKFNTLENLYYPSTIGEKGILVLAGNHNWLLLASYGDLTKDNGIYSILLVFMVLLLLISIVAVLTLGAVFCVSSMQREREFALLSGIGASVSQINKMVLFESACYCLTSLPFGFFLGILAYQGIEHHLGNLFYSLCRISPVPLVISFPYTVVMVLSAICVILLSGFSAARKASRTQPVSLLRKTNDISLRRNTLTDAAIYGKKVSNNVERWLAKTSYRRFRRRDRPILLMLAVTFMLCLVLDGFRLYSTEVMELKNSGLTYNFKLDLYSDDKADMEELADALVQLSTDTLVPVREALFSLREPYPFSKTGESLLSGNQVLPDVSLLCIADSEFENLCGNLDIPDTADGIYGIFLDTERSWENDGIKMKGHPYDVAAGDTVMLYQTPWAEDGGDGIAVHIVGVSDTAPLYAEITQSTRMQILVPESLFEDLEIRRYNPDADPGLYHISLRGNLADCATFERNAKTQTDKFPSVTVQVSNYEEQLRQNQAGNDSFVFLCAALIAVFTFICICGNVTVSWTTNQSREREFATLLSIGMTNEQLRKMNMFDLLHNIWCAFIPGILAGAISYQLIYQSYRSEFLIRWRFPILGLLLGIVILFFSVGTTELILQVRKKKLSLSEQLRTED